MGNWEDVRNDVKEIRVNGFVHGASEKAVKEAIAERLDKLVVKDDKR